MAELTEIVERNLQIEKISNNQTSHLDWIENENAVADVLMVESGEKIVVGQYLTILEMVDPNWIDSCWIESVVAEVALEADEEDIHHLDLNLPVAAAIVVVDVKLYL